MKLLVTFLALVALSTQGFSQITWDNATAPTARGFETEDDIETHNLVTFTQPGPYRWVRTYTKSCGVQTAICDKNQCYLETTDSADFTVEANESFDMICHFYPYDTCCPEGAEVTLYVYKVDNPAINSTATYKLDLWCASLSVDNVSSNGLYISPNPATDVIQISVTDAKASVVVTNLLGEQVAVSALGNGQYDVSELKQGVYLFTVQSEGESLTQRFIKN